MSFTRAFRVFAAAAFALSLFAQTSCKSGGTGYDYKTEPDPRKLEFQIGPLDQIQVRVWKNQDLSAEVTVRPDGIITLPLIGDVKAAGRTPTELQKEIHTRLGAFIRGEELVVSVGVSAVNSYHFTIVGAVEHAGVFTARSYVSAVEAVAMAGGPNRFSGSEIYIVRGTPARKIPIDLKRAQTPEHADENIIVLRGDMIVVQ